MPFYVERTTRRLGNWFIDRALKEVLEKHAKEDLWFEHQDRVYVGVTDRLEEVVDIFSRWLK